MFEQCMELAEPARRKISGVASVDGYVGLPAFLAITLARLGYIEEARSTMNEALSEARRLQHAHTLGQVLCHANSLDLLTGSPPTHVEEVLSLATEHHYPLYLAYALKDRGRRLIRLGQAREGLTLVLQALAKKHAMGLVAGTASDFAWLARAHALLGQSDEARNCLAETTQILETTDERVSEAEVLYRVPGDLLKAAGDLSGAEQHYRQAIAVAERQSAKLDQLRASTSLARLWRDQGRQTEAHDLLAPIYDWFTEGFDVPVLMEAKALLDELV